MEVDTIFNPKTCLSNGSFIKFHILVLSKEVIRRTNTGLVENNVATRDAGPSESPSNIAYIAIGAMTASVANIRTIAFGVRKITLNCLIP